MQTVRAMGIPDENITLLKDASHDELVRGFQKLEDKIKVLARVLTPHTGILAATPISELKGLSWDRIKQDAM